MNGREYQNAARQYALFPLNNSGWDYLLSALPEELGELWEVIDTDDTKAILSEAGDITWNLALMSHLLGSELGSETPDGHLCSDPVVAVGKLSGIFAKTARKGHGRSLTSEQREEVISWIASLLCYIDTLAYQCKSSLSAVFNYNINKLEERRRTNTIEGSGETVEERRAN